MAARNSQLRKHFQPTKNSVEQSDFNYNGMINGLALGLLHL